MFRISQLLFSAPGFQDEAVANIRDIPNCTKGTDLPKLMELKIKVDEQFHASSSDMTFQQSGGAPKPKPTTKDSSMEKLSSSSSSKKSLWDEKKPTSERRLSNESASRNTSTNKCRISPMEQKQSTETRQGNSPKQTKPKQNKNNSSNTKSGATNIPTIANNKKNNKNGYKAAIDITPMQIEVLPNVKNAEKSLVVQSRERSSRSPSPPFNSQTNGATSIENPSVKSEEKNTTPLLSATKIENQFAFTSIYQEMSLETKKDSFLKVFVSEVVNPGLFYVHVVSPEAAKLDAMMDSLNVFYNTHGEWDVYTLTFCIFCI